MTIRDSNGIEFRWRRDETTCVTVNRDDLRRIIDALDDGTFRGPFGSALARLRAELERARMPAALTAEKIRADQYRNALETIERSEWFAPDTLRRIAREALNNQLEKP